MFYAVQWLRGEMVVGQSGFDDLLAAKAYARDRLGIHKVRKGATAARVTDAEGVVYFRFGEGAS